MLVQFNLLVLGNLSDLVILALIMGKGLALQ
jgi:hypothetical protein